MNQIARLTLLAVAVCFFFQNQTVIKAAPPEKPNIIFILADDKN